MYRSFALFISILPLLVYSQQCDPNFSVEFDWEVNASNEVLFVGTANMAAEGFIYYFPNGNEAYGPTATQVLEPGEHLVCMSAWYWIEQTQDTCWTEYCELIEIGGGSNECDPNYSVEFNWTALGGGNVNFVAFPNMTSDDVIWFFGDGELGYGNVTDHHFDEAGEYNVCVAAYYWNAQTQDTCWTEYCEVIEIGGGTECDPNFSVEFDWEVNASNEVLFVGTANMAADGFIYYFPNGVQAAGPTATQVLEPGEHLVCMSAWYWIEQTQDTCWTEYCEVIEIGGGSNECDPNYSVDFNWTALGGGNVNFVASPNMTTDDVIWFFGDGEMGYGNVTDHHFGEAGEYNVCVAAYYWNAQTQDTCWTEYCEVIEIGGGGTECDPNFSVGFDWEVNASNEVLFVGTSNMVADGFIYYFPNGVQAAGPTATQVLEPGEHLVCMSAWYWNAQTQDTCWTEYCEVIEIGGGGTECDPNFSVGFDWEVNASNEVLFVGTSNVVADGFIYYFPNGVQAAGPTATQVLEPGEHLVCMSAWYWIEQTQDTCWTEYCEVIEIGGGSNECDPNYSVDFNWTALGGGNVNFVASPNMTTDDVIWFFGDGEMGYGNVTDHHFDEAGEYNVCVAAYYWNAQTEDTCWTEHCEVIEVGGGGDPCAWLDACFTIEMLSPTTFSFINCTPNESGIQYFWDFDDGGNAETQHAVHVFDPGTYEVCLIAVWGNCMDTVCTTIDVVEGYTCEGFTTQITWNAPGGNAVVLEATSNLVAGGYVWYFPDGTIADGQTVTHQFAESGAYIVCVVAWIWDEVVQDLCYTDECTMVQVVVGLNENAPIGNWSVFPNPAKDHLIIDGDELSGTADLELYSADGRLQRAERVDRSPHRMQLNGLAPGVHLLRLEQHDGVQHFRVVIE